VNFWHSFRGICQLAVLIKFCKIKGYLVKKNFDANREREREREKEKERYKK
jgi:hypothetical protein